MAEQLTTAQRMMNFSALTRQNIHMLPSQEVNGEYGSMQFIFPKTRLLAKTYLKFDVTVNVAHGSKTKLEPKNEYDFYKVIRKITMDMNNGFMPVVASGEELAIFNTIATHAEKVYNEMISVKELTVSTNGTTNTYSFVLELKNTLNDSQLQGLLMLQNQSTVVTLNVDTGSIADIVNGQDGYTGTVEKVKCTPCMVSYTIPNDERAMPDISVLKVIHSKAEIFTTGGTNTIYLDTGMIYRKLILKIEDADGNVMTPSDFTGNFELAFNTADIPYSVSADMLKYMNADEFGTQLPNGIYVFDFSSQSPLIGYGGNRDYIDTEKLTQFTFKFNTSKACKVTVISERLSRLSA